MREVSFVELLCWLSHAKTSCSVGSPPRPVLLLWDDNGAAAMCARIKAAFAGERWLSKGKRNTMKREKNANAILDDIDVKD